MVAYALLALVVECVVPLLEDNDILWVGKRICHVNLEGRERLQVVREGQSDV